MVVDANQNIYVLPSIIANDKSSFDFFSSLLKELRLLGKNILVDFSSCVQFDGNLCAVMGAIFDVLTAEGVSISLTTPYDKSVKRVLGRNKFFASWNLETNFIEKEYYISYHRFDVKDTQLFKEYISKELIHKQKFPQHTELAGKYLVDNIYEIYANATMHGHASFVHACGEYDIKTHVLHMSIIDCGRTIVENVNEFLTSKGETPLTPTKAILWAFVEGNTTKSEPGGLGMAQLKQFMSMNDGKLDVISGRGWVSSSGNDDMEYELKDEFPGTIVNLHFNFDDTNEYRMASERPININDLL